MDDKDKSRDQLLGELNELRRRFAELEKAENETRLTIETLRESEARFRNLIENATIGIVRTKIDGSKVLDANPELCKILGLSREEFVGQPSAIAWAHPEQREDLVRLLREKGTVNNYEIDIRTKSGEIRTVLMSMTAYPDLGYLEGGLQDITERKQAEEKLQKSESKYKDLFKNAQVGMYRTKIDGSAFLDVNQKFADILGFLRAELLGSPGRIRWVDPDNRDKMMKLLKEQDGHLADFEAQVLAKDGSIRDVLASIRLYPAEGYLEGAMVDITERNKAEKALKESEHKFHDTVKYLDEGYYSCNIDGLLLEHNQAFNQILGFDITQNLKGEKLPDFWQNPDDRKEYLNELMAKGFIRNYLINAKTISGRKIVVMANSHLVRDEKDRIIRIDGTFTDFTEPKRIQDELERSNKELEQFAYVASHDLQEPLRMISSFTQLLARRYKDKLDAEANEFIDYAVDGANRMQRLINDLLIYSRIGTRGKPFVVTDLNDIIGQVLVNLNPAIEENHVIITNDELPTVSVDDTQMIQLFQNLIGNAVKFCAAETPCVHISVKENNREWIIGVKDNGIGIDPQYKERIFKVFQRLHSKEEYPGTGIGLAICRKIVERHGGRIWVESELGNGATFYFTITKDHV